VWLKAIVQYASAASAVRPQLERVKRWQLAHDAKEKELHKVEKLLAKADQTVADLCADANAALRDLDASTANMRMLKTRVDNANAVLRGLAGDAARWGRPR
jgi:DNA repair ATPase RecN